MANYDFRSYDVDPVMAASRPLLPSLPLLRAFEAAARLRNFTAAASELGLTQAAVSQQIRSLEAHLEVRLFRRLARGVELTPEAAAYLPHVQAGFRTIAESTVDLFGPRQGRVVRIRSPISFATLWIAPRLARFASAFPHVLLEVSTIHTPADYDGEPGFDIRFGSGSFSGRTCYRLTAERLVPVAGGLGDGSPDAVWADRPLLAVSGARELWSQWFAFAGHSPQQRTILRCDSFVMAFHAASSGTGILLGSRPLIDTALSEGVLQRLSGQEMASHAGHFLTHPDDMVLRGTDRLVCDWWQMQGAGASA